jgi:AmmeMemoRadiSam system protein B/AmmeMemoRadiSam system protein A
MASWIPPLVNWGQSVPGSDPLLLPGCIWLLGIFLCCALAGASRGGSREPGVREPILAGRWYESEPAELRRSVQGYLQGVGRPDVPLPAGLAETRAWVEEGRHPLALVVPHAGHMYSGACAAQGFRLLQGSETARVILLGPSHQFGFRGAALPQESAFATPLGRIPLDTETLAKLAAMPGFQRKPEAHAGEHSLEIELPFLQAVLPEGFRLVPIVIGRLERAELDAIAAALHPLLVEGTILVVSSDFTHYGPNYGYLPFRAEIPEHLRKLDLGAADRILARDLPAFEAYVDSTDATICGAEPIRILLRALEGIPLEGRLADYYRSGDVTGDFQNSVSYAAIAFFPTRASARAPAPEPPEFDEDHPAPLTRDEQAFLLDLARRTVRAVVHGQPAPEGRVPDRFPEASPLHEERGVFVTLTTRRDGQLRGCIGSIVGDQPLSFGVVQNASAAALHDPRFAPVEPAEEPGLHIEVSVLTPLRPVDGPDAIVVGRDGVFLEKGARRAVFLPQVAPEQGWDRETMLRHLAMKAGLGPSDWKTGCAFHVFQAQVFEEVDSPGLR